jgi:hypothetical protein
VLGVRLKTIRNGKSVGVGLFHEDGRPIAFAGASDFPEVLAALFETVAEREIGRLAAPARTAAARHHKTRRAR